MAKKIHFREEQKFRQWWIWAIILLTTGVWFYSIIVQVIMGKDFGNNPGSDFFVVLIGILPIIIVYVFLRIKLITVVDNEGVHYRFAPWQRKAKTITPDDIKEYHVRKYRPIMEYGGWGVRKSIRKYGNAYNVAGNVGMQFELNNGKKFLIGTHKAESFKRALDKLMERSQKTGFIDQ